MKDLARFRNKLIIGSVICVLMLLIFGGFVSLSSRDITQGTYSTLGSGEEPTAEDLHRLTNIYLVLFLVTLFGVSGFLSFMFFWLNHYLHQGGELDLAANGMSKTDENNLVLSAERNKLAVILSGINDGIIALDKARRVTTINKPALKLIGQERDQCLGRPIGELIELVDGISETIISEDKYAPEQTTSFEGVVFSGENISLLAKSEGNKYRVRFSSFHIAEGERLDIGCILTIHDRSKEAQLEKMKLDFVSMAAHELRTPITAINSYLYIFIKENRDKLSSEQNMFLNRINISTQQLLALVENLLNVSRIEKGAFKVYPEPNDWVEIVQQSVNMMMNRALERKIDLEFSGPKAEFPKVLVDKLRVSEVLINLLSNAIAYTSSGGKVRVWLEQNGDEVITHVSDTGAGIPEEAIGNLFTKFYRVAGKLEQGSKGTGLGLYIARTIVEHHHGRIWVNSKLGVGSTFSFSLPIAKNIEESDGSKSS